MDNIAQAMNKLLRACGTDRVKTGDILVCRECLASVNSASSASGPSSRSSCVFGLVSGASWKPLLQDFTLYRVVGGKSLAGSGPLPLPFRVEVEVAPLRLQVEGLEEMRGFRHATSEELALTLAETNADRFKLSLCEYKVLSAMQMEV